MNLPVETWIFLSISLLPGLPCGWLLGRRQTGQAFHVLSAEAPASSNQTFLDLAGTTLEAYQKQAADELDNRQQAIRQRVKPLETETSAQIDKTPQPPQLPES